MNEQHHPPISIDEMAHAFEDEDGPIDLSHHTIEDWLTLAVFWAMAVCVFLQFFTRYALNSSLARARRNRRQLSGDRGLSGLGHVHAPGHCTSPVDLIYNFLPRRSGARLEGRGRCHLHRLLRLCLAWLMWRYIDIVGSERMVTCRPAARLYASHRLCSLRADAAALGAEFHQGFDRPQDGPRRGGPNPARRGYDAMLLLIGSFLLLMVIGVPVAVAMAVASLAYIGIYNVAPDIIAAAA